MVCDAQVVGGDNGTGAGVGELEAEAQGKMDATGLSIHRFNQHVAADPRSLVSMVSIRDGVTLIKKLKEGEF